MQLALDQAYHPDGFYTFPTDSALRNEILMARQIGLNGLREHIKIEAPRKLYWADRLGVLIMADVPNWWGPPDSAAFREHETAMRGMIARDYNHPAVFSWVMFNETWGLQTKDSTKDGARERYLPETQRKVASVYRLAKSLDPTRLVEDNSICCGAGHTETDLNSWHEYLPGWRWAGHVARLSDSTFTGSPFHFEKGYTQGHQPMLNSEFGNVWGYNGKHRRRRLELGLPPRHRRLPPQPQALRVALHRAPRRHQRVERLLALRPHGEGDRTRRPRPGDVAPRLAQSALRRRRRLAPEPRRARRRDG